MCVWLCERKCLNRNPSIKWVCLVLLRCFCDQQKKSVAIIIWVTTKTERIQWWKRKFARRTIVERQTMTKPTPLKIENTKQCHFVNKLCYHLALHSLLSLVMWSKIRNFLITLQHKRQKKSLNWVGEKKTRDKDFFRCSNTMDAFLVPHVQFTSAIKLDRIRLWRTTNRLLLHLRATNFNHNCCIVLNIFQFFAICTIPTSLQLHRRVHYCRIKRILWIFSIPFLHSSKYFFKFRDCSLLGYVGVVWNVVKFLREKNVHDMSHSWYQFINK